MFIKEQNENISEDELALCFNETINDLKLVGIDSSYYLNIGNNINVDIATSVYDFYETVVEAAFDSLESLLIRVHRNKQMITASIDVICHMDLEALSDSRTNVSFDKDENVYTLTRTEYLG